MDQAEQRETKVCLQFKLFDEPVYCFINVKTSVDNNRMLGTCCSLFMTGTDKIRD